ncbi:MAG: acetate--CoA ligase family protein [Sphingomonadales bacterium]|nr:acetate--CoA ligase family protein [Sphingomonadales bacterium]
MAQALLRARAGGFSGKAWLINDRQSEVDGVPCVTRAADLPEAPDAVFLGTNAESSVDYVAQFAAIGTGGVACYASGFAEAGRADLQAALVAAAGDMALLGPNCYGMLDYLHQSYLWPVAFGGQRVTRGVAILTQSGNFAYNISMLEAGLPLSYLVSLGNQASLGVVDFMAALLDQPGVTAFGLHLEAVSDPAAFAKAAAKAALLGVPIVALKSGGSELGAQIALSHTSSLAGSDDLCSAFFAELGVIRVDTPTQLVDTLTLLQASSKPIGPRVSAMVCSGGDAGFVADGCARFGLSLPAVEMPAGEALAALLPAYATVANPLDFTTAIWARAEPLSAVARLMAGQSDVDVALAAVDYPTETSGERPQFDIMLDAFTAGCEAAGRPGVVTSIFGGLLPAEVKARLMARGVAAYDGLERALYAVAKASSAQRQAGEVTLLPGVPGDAARSLAEADSKALLAGYGLDVARGKVVVPSAARRAAEGIAGPCVLKVVHEAIAHKSDVGGVVLNLKGAEAVQTAADAMVARFALSHPKLVIDRVLVEEMLPAPLAELIVGVARDPVFGLYLVIGSGGVLVELIRDSAIVLFPASRERIVAALESLAVWPLLRGFRGAALADLDAVVAAVMAVAAFASDHADRLAELDVNPLMVFSDRAVAVDAFIRLA